MLGQMTGSRNQPGFNTLKLKQNEDDEMKLDILQGRAKHKEKQLQAQRIDITLCLDINETIKLQKIVFKTDKT